MMIMEFLKNLLELSLAAAPWLVLGLVVGGFVKAMIPLAFLERHLGGQGIGPIIKAALLGAPLPLCSCGVIPAALGLRKAGASKQATVSFLVSTPETGVDSVTITYALLGPFMAAIRPIAAIASAITAGLLVGRIEAQPAKNECTSEVGCCSAEKKTAASCCDQNVVEESSSCCTSEPMGEAGSCCSDSGRGKGANKFLSKLAGGIEYAFTDLYSMLLFWLSIGLLFAAAVKTFLPPDFLTEWGSGLPAMLVMMVIGIPMYVCATASTPIAAGFMLAGVSPGTALVFLMAGPATNISTLGVIGKELGQQSLFAYLFGVGFIALVAGLITDFLVKRLGIDIQSQLQAGEEMIPYWLAMSSLVILVFAAVRAVLRKQ